MPEVTGPTRKEPPFDSEGAWPVLQARTCSGAAGCQGRQTRPEAAAGREGRGDPNEWLGR